MQVYVSADIEGVAGIAHWDEATKDHAAYGGICQAARRFNPAIQAVETGLGTGASNTGLHPAKARSAIAEGITKALDGDLAACRIELPPNFEIHITFKNHAGAYRAGLYPGARAVDAETVALEADDFFDIARFLNFV